MVLDSSKNRMTIFEETTYAANVKEALRLYSVGDYTGSAQICKEILYQNANCGIAYISLGRAMIQQGADKEAMAYLKKGDDRAAYSEAFRLYRMQFIRENFFWLLAGFILLCILVKVLYRLVRRWLGYPVRKKRMIYR